MTTCAILIPVHQPPADIAGWIDDLRQQLLEHAIDAMIWIVDDGCAPELADTFARLAAIPGVRLVRNAVNVGIGAALKTGINAILVEGPVDSIVAVDGDAGHVPGEILKLAERSRQDPSRLYLGSRRGERGGPLLTSLGRGATRAMTRLLTGLRSHDTQAGLRALPRDLCEAALRIPLNGYDFEIECLIEARRLREGRLPIVEVPIAGPPGVDARARQFNPLLDSMRIYFVFLRYCGGSLLTFLADYAIFVFVFAHTQSIGLGIALARGVAIFVSFVFNRAAVFHFRRAAAPAFARFLLLVVALGWISYLATSYLSRASGMPPAAAKLLVEAVLFFAGFALNNLFVFNRAVHDDASTDWDDYYSRPYRAASVTRRITTGLLVRLMRKYGASNSARPTLLELGGANSCFVAALRAAVAPGAYHIVDNNKTGLSLSRERKLPDEPLFVHDVDLLTQHAPLQADITFSVGLIEHFDAAGTARLVDEHFRATRPGGLVIVTFPTATWLYRAIRGVAEWLKVWIFFDERPLTEGEVLAAAGANGTLLYSRINWAIGLTQRVMAFRREAQAADRRPSAAASRPAARRAGVEDVPLAR